VNRNVCFWQQSLSAMSAFGGWLLVVGAIAVLGTPRPRFEQH
jgi:hypothetical protein